MLWSGSIADIPGGWHLCNGNSGTPDLQDRFIVGAGNSYFVDDTGGACAHVHTGETGYHTHGIGGGSDIEAGNAYGEDVSSVKVSFTTDSVEGLPPYFALAYIMKL